MPNKDSLLQVDINEIKIQLSRNKFVFESLFASFVTDEEQRWKPSEEKWSALEILCHLFDEERDDFRARIDFILKADEGDSMPSIDPKQWVIENDYFNQNFAEKYKEFMKERTASIIYLDRHQNADWSKKYDHPFLKEVDPYFFLSNWLAHDYLHIRQILNLKFDYLKASNSRPLDYAGNW